MISNLYTQHRAWMHNSKIRSLTLFRPSQPDAPAAVDFWWMGLLACFVMSQEVQVFPCSFIRAIFKRCIKFGDEKSLD